MHSITQKRSFQIKKVEDFFRISLTPISFNNKKKLLSYRKLGMWHPFPYTDFLKLTTPLRCIPIKVEFQVFAKTKLAGYAIYFGGDSKHFQKAHNCPEEAGRMWGRQVKHSSGHPIDAVIRYFLLFSIVICQWDWKCTLCLNDIFYILISFNDLSNYIQ